MTANNLGIEPQSQSCGKKPALFPLSHPRQVFPRVQIGLDFLGVRFSQSFHCVTNPNKLITLTESMILIRLIANKNLACVVTAWQLQDTAVGSCISAKPGLTLVVFKKYNPGLALNNPVLNNSAQVIKRVLK